jgi:hypothetical protein
MPDALSLEDRTACAISPGKEKVSGIFFTAHGIANPSVSRKANRLGMHSESVKKIPDTFSFCYDYLFDTGDR